MTCSDFLARYSDFLDGESSPEGESALRSHLEACASCRRYDHVVRRGIALLRDLPAERLRDDFKDRLQHSLYTIDEAERRRRHRPQGATGGGAMAVVAAAVIILAVVWTPALWDSTPTVDLPAIVVRAPEQAASRATLPENGIYALPQPRPSPVYDADLWRGSNHLLFESSPLYTRHREPGLVRTGLH